MNNASILEQVKNRLYTYGGATQMKTIFKRDNREVPFDESKITSVIHKAFTAAGNQEKPMMYSYP